MQRDSLGRDKLVTAATEARKSSWAGTGSAAISTASNGISAEVLALVRTRWFSKPLSMYRRSWSSLLQHKIDGRVIQVTGREILLLTVYFDHFVGFRNDINANLMLTCVFSRGMEDSHLSWERTSISHPACGKTGPPMEAPSGSKSLEHRWSLQSVPHTHVPYTQG